MPGKRRKIKKQLNKLRADNTNWVKRADADKKQSTKDNKTHFMGYSTIGEKGKERYLVFPTVREKMDKYGNRTLKETDGKESVDEAYKRRDGLVFDKKEDAEWASSVGYKQYTNFPKKDVKKAKEDYKKSKNKESVKMPKRNKSFRRWKKDLPDNLRKTKKKDYDLKKAYKVGMDPAWNEADQSYHLQSRDPRTGEYIKSVDHPSSLHAAKLDREVGYEPVIAKRTFGKPSLYTGSKNDPAKTKGKVLAEGDEAIKYLTKRRQKAEKKPIGTSRDLGAVKEAEREQQINEDMKKVVKFKNGKRGFPNGKKKVAMYKKGMNGGTSSSEGFSSSDASAVLSGVSSMTEDEDTRKGLGIANNAMSVMGSVGVFKKGVKNFKSKSVSKQMKLKCGMRGHKKS